MDSLKSVGLMHSKHRNALGLVGVEIPYVNPIAQVRLARQWSRKDLHKAPAEIGAMYQKHRWHKTYMDQQSGQHLIQDIRAVGVPISTIITQKDLKDPKGIEKVKIMDKIEMVQFMVMLIQQKKIKWSPRPSATMKELEEQFVMFIEHKTEAGSVDYYAPGDEFDNLTKAFMVSCFAGRKILSGDEGGVIAGPLSQNVERDPYTEFTQAFPASGW